MFLHQIFYQGLKARISSWPTLVLGECHLRRLLSCSLSEERAGRGSGCVFFLAGPQNSLAWARVEAKAEADGDGRLLLHPSQVHSHQRKANVWMQGKEKACQPASLPSCTQPGACVGLQGEGLDSLEVHTAGFALWDLHDDPIHSLPPLDSHLPLRLMGLC